MAFGLRRKLTTRVILPFLLGIFVITGFDMWYLYTYLKSLLDDLIDSLKEDKRDIQMNQAQFQSDRTGNLLQIPINYMLISHTITSKLYAGTLDVNSSFTGESNYENSVEYPDIMTTLTGYDADTTKNYNYAIWYLDTETTDYDTLEDTTKENIFNSAILDSLHSSVVILESSFSIYVAYDYDSLLYFLPAQLVCPFTPDYTSCTGTEAFVTKDRPWYQASSANTAKDDITLIDPYKSANSDEIGQTACHTIWQDDNLHSISCIDFLVNEIFASDSEDDFYHYVLNLDGEVYYHPAFQKVTTDSKIYTIEEYEFNDTDSSYRQDEIDAFDKDIKPKFDEEVASSGSYEKQGEVL